MAGVLTPNRNLAVRIVTAVVLFPFAAWVTWRGGLAFALVVAAAAAVSAAELMLMFQRRLAVLEWGGVAVAGLLPLAAWGGWRNRGEFVADWVGLSFAGATILLLLLALFRDGPLEEAPRAAGVAGLAWLYCGVLPASAVAIRQRFGWEWVILAFVVSWANDILAYFSGRFLGRHKLMERISPKKTWEGFAGGALGHDDRHQKRPNHRHKHSRDEQQQQDHKGLVEFLLAHETLSIAPESSRSGFAG